MQVSRNAPCPCGSGRKYKKCCLSQDEIAAAEKRKEQAEVIEATQADDIAATQADDYELIQYESELDKLSNKANDLINAEKWDEAFAVCKQLEEQYPDQLDADIRFGDYYKARGDFVKAKEYNQASIKRMQADPENYDPEMLEDFIGEVQCLDECINAGKLVH